MASIPVVDDASDPSVPDMAADRSPSPRSEARRYVVIADRGPSALDDSWEWRSWEVALAESATGRTWPLATYVLIPSDRDATRVRTLDAHVAQTLRRTTDAGSVVAIALACWGLADAPDQQLVECRAWANTLLEQMTDTRIRNVSHVAAMEQVSRGLGVWLPPVRFHDSRAARHPADFEPLFVVEAKSRSTAEGGTARPPAEVCFISSHSTTSPFLPSLFWRTVDGLIEAVPLTSAGIPYALALARSAHDERPQRGQTKLLDRMRSWMRGGPAVHLSVQAPARASPPRADRRRAVDARTFDVFWLTGETSLAVSSEDASRYAASVDLAIDLAGALNPRKSMQVIHEGKPVPVSKKAKFPPQSVHVLARWIQRRGEALTTDQMAGELWSEAHELRDQSDVGFDRVVEETRVKNLRRETKRALGSSAIRTNRPVDDDAENDDQRARHLTLSIRKAVGLGAVIRGHAGSKSGYTFSLGLGSAVVITRSRVTPLE